jgi:hypothetical protein
VADFNCDGKVDLADLSAYLFLTGYASQANPADLNEDGNVNLADASVLFYYWSDTGSGFRLPTFATRPIIPNPAEIVSVDELGKDNIIPKGGRRPLFGIQEEGLSLVKKATSSLATLFNIIIDFLIAVISGFLRFMRNIVQLR